MELHRNGVLFCKIFRAQRGDTEGIAYQFGDINPLQSVEMIFILVEKMPDLSLGVRYSICEDKDVAPISIEGFLRDGDDLWLKCYVIAT